MSFTQDQIDLLNAKLDASYVKERKAGNGMMLSYVEGWRVIAEANRIFRHDGWSSFTDDLRQIGDPREVDGKWRVAWMAKVRIVVGNVTREGIGYGSGIDRDIGGAHESAIKEAETDARKRGLMTFGWPFGLALYDKAREHVDNGDSAPKVEDMRRDPPAPSTPKQEAPKGIPWVNDDGTLEYVPKGSEWFALALKKIRASRDAPALWAVNGKTARGIVERAPASARDQAQRDLDKCIEAVDAGRDTHMAA